MTAPKPDSEAIFHRAREISDPVRRGEYVREACGGDEARLAHIEALLAAADASDSLLDRPAGTFPGRNYDQPTPEAAGTLIGPYKLIEPIGEGGMGTVWKAQQTEPVRRFVALKLIKTGMDSRQVIARFDAERQALALMDHPNIAKILDGGTTSAGRLYFAMDLVRGTPITKYCDEYRLTPRQRLELFVPVCQAIQHAHQKGIIHRDIKPSNVLVALNDGQPLPKVIDFGVAKAVGQPLTEQTLVTGFGAIVGTFEYMSPEQAQLNQLDVDTRSDIYSLGVLLYELLTGSPPFRRKELEQAGVLEMLRVIREQEPSKPSTKLSTADGLPVLAANRGTEPEKLTRLVRGELDWIVMKALEKDRSRRYETAAGFAADLERYLSDEPVQACPPSAGYRLRKFARRNKGPVLAASLLALVLVGGIIGTTTGMFWALDERDAKEQARRAAETNERKAQTAAAEARSAESEARKAEQRARTAEAQERKAREQAQARLQQIEKASLMLGTVLTDIAQSNAERTGEGVKAFFAQRLDGIVGALNTETIDDPLTLARLRLTFGSCYWRLGFSHKAIPLLEAAVNSQKKLVSDFADRRMAMLNLASAYRDAGHAASAVPLYEEMLKLNTEQFGPDHLSTVWNKFLLAGAYQAASRPRDAIPLIDDVVRFRQLKLGPDHRDTLISMNMRAAIYTQAGRLAEALKLQEEVLQLHLAKYGTDDASTTPFLANLAAAYQVNGDFEKSVQTYERLLRIYKDKYGPEHEMTLRYMNSLAGAYVSAGRAADALALSKEALPAMRRKLGIAARETTACVRLIASCCEELGRPAEAEPLCRELADFWKRRAGGNSMPYADQLALLGRNLVKQGKPDLAEPLLRECLAIRNRYAPDLWMTFEAKSILGAALLDQQKYDDAKPLLLDGYRGMKDRVATMPNRIVPLDALSWLVKLYDALEDPGEAARWRKELEDRDQRIKKTVPPEAPDP